MPTYPALQVQSLNLPGIMQAAQNYRMGEAKLGQFQQQSRMQQMAQQHVPSALEGDPEALKNVFINDPEKYKQVQDFVDNASDQERVQTKERQVTKARLGLSVLQAEEFDRPAAYQRARAQAAQANLDVDQIPPNYDPSILPQLETWVSEALDLGEAVKYAEKEKGQKDFTLSPGQTRYEAGGEVIAREPAATSKQKGGSWAMDTLLEYKRAIDTGEQPSQDLISRAEAAVHLMNKKNFFRDPEGNLLSSTLGVPPGFPTPGTQTQVSPLKGQRSPGTQIQTEIEAPGKVTKEMAMNTLGNIADLLEEADAAGETITGFKGWAKAKGGGIARQLGADVSERSERLMRFLETLKGQMGPLLLQEKRLSETERNRLDTIIGAVTATDDEVSLRSALADLAEFIEKLDAK